MKFIGRETTLEDLQADPKSYGLPTYEEFMKNRETYMGRPDDVMASIINGPMKGRKDLEKVKFQIHGVDMPSPESVETALADHGFSIEDIDLENRNSKLKKKIDMVPLGGGKFDVVVNFMP